MKKVNHKILVPSVAGKKEGVYTVVNADLIEVFEGTAKECCNYIDGDIEITEDTARLNASVDNFESFFGSVRMID